MTPEEKKTRETAAVVVFCFAILAVLFGSTPLAIIVAAVIVADSIDELKKKE